MLKSHTLHRTQNITWDSPEIEELASKEKGPKVERRGPRERGNCVERDELDELQEMSYKSHGFGRVFGIATEIYPGLRVSP